MLLAFTCFLLTQPSHSSAQPFIGANVSGSGSIFTFNVPLGVTNLSLRVTNSVTAFSHLYLKRGTGASVASYDFVSRLDRTNNHVNLELPELLAGSDYSLWVNTPTNSAAHAFGVILSTNRSDARSVAMPIAKVVEASAAGDLASGEAHYFQVDVPTNMPGWRLVLNSTGSADPDLYVQRGYCPSPTAYLKRSVARPLDTIFLDGSEATNGTLFISVLVPKTQVGTSSYTLRAEIAPMVTLDWEPGTDSLPRAAFTNQSDLGGDYFFKVVARAGNFGAWRTRVDVAEGEASLLLRQTSMPTTTTYNYASAQVGSEGLVLVQGSQYQTGQVWYAMVTATPEAKWSIYSGNLYVPVLAAPGGGSGGGTNTTFAPEGMNFYRTTINSNTIAWRLGLDGLTNSLYVRQGTVALTNGSSYYDWKHAGQILLVPPYLKSGVDYFVTVVGAPGQPLTVDSRQQPILEFPFDSTLQVAATNYGYVTLRVTVPPNQIGWQLDLGSSSGDPALAVRQAAVGNDYISTAYSATTNVAFETLTLVPPTLTDGSYYVTVFGTPPFVATLTNSRPVVTDLSYSFQVTNDVASRVGWRYYRVGNIDEQLKSLGWELMLRNFVPGSEIAVRRNALPSRWNSRTNYLQTGVTSAAQALDAASAKGFLQMPRHPADIWYIGVNHKTQPLGPFVLSGQEIPRLDLTLEPVVRVNQVEEQRAGMFQYFQVEVPTKALGIELRVANVASGDPRVVVCRGLLPVSLTTMLVNSNSWTPNNSNSWPPGAQAAYETDWTGFSTDARGSNELGHFFFAGRGNPLEPGVYYIGVINGPLSTNEMKYELWARGIFPDGSVEPLALEGTRIGSNLLPHGVSWHRVTIPVETPSWKLRLDSGLGESFFTLRREGLANYGAVLAWPTNMPGCKVRKIGNEHLVLLPQAPSTNLPAGTYYVGVVAEGQGPVASRAGSNACSYTLSSLGPLVLTNLGTVDPLGQTGLVVQATQEGGEVVGYKFSVASNTHVIEVRLNDRIGNPRMSLRADTQLPACYDKSYGSIGGWAATWSDDNLIRIPTPAAGTYTLLVQAASSGSVYTNTSYTLEVSAQAFELVSFDGGSLAVTNQPSDAWRYFLVTVPTNVMGWDLRLTNITNGDPRMVICRDVVYPSSLATRTANGGAWSPYTATNWPSGWQIAPERDWTGYAQSAVGSNILGTVFMAASGNPLEPGAYLVGVTSGSTSTTTNLMSYTLVSRGIGTNSSIGIEPLSFAAGEGRGVKVATREAKYYRVDVSEGAPSWQLRLGMTAGDGLLVLRKGGLPNMGAAMGTAVTNLAGCKLQKTGDEHFVLLPQPPSNSIPAGTYYVGVISEGVGPAGTRLGSGTSDFVLQSIGPVPVIDLGRVDASTYIERTVAHPGGAVLVFQYDVVPASTLALVSRLDSRTNNPVMTLRAGTVLPRTLETYGRQGGWAEDWNSPSYIRVSSSAGGKYTLVVQAGAVSSQYPDASYTLRIYPLEHYTIPLEFDGGKATFVNHLAGEWLYFAVDVPGNATGWDLRLTNILSGSPQMVICRSGYPVDLTSRLASGAAWSWGASTNWPVGAQASPGLDWTGYRWETDPFSPGGTNLVDSTSTVFAAGMGSPLEPGKYIIGVSSAVGTSKPLSYTIVSRGIGTDFSIPVTTIPGGNNSVTGNGLGPRQAAYYSIQVETNTPLWKIGAAPSSGEALLIVRKGALPNVTAATNVLAGGLGGGHKFQKAGAENALLGEVINETNLSPGLYYVAVVGEGGTPQPAKGIIGTGTTDFILNSSLPCEAVDLGIVRPGAADVLVTNLLASGETAPIRFRLSEGAVSLTVSLEEVTGTARLRLRGDGHWPLDQPAYGQDGKYSSTWEHTNRVAVINPAIGDYRLTVLADRTGTNWTSLQYVLRIHAESVAPTLAFDGGSVRINEHSNLWRVFTVNVPPGALGWDLRLLNVSNGAPRLVIRRDQFPKDLSSDKVPYSSTSWATGGQMAPALDWTGYNEADGRSSTGRVFQVGMGNPLQPGTYYVGITNVDGADASCYTVVSRGIGSGFSIPVENILFSGGSATKELPAREVAWYRVDVPPNMASWKMVLNFDAGDGVLLAQRGVLPSIGASNFNAIAQKTGGRKIEKPGDEQLLYLAAGKSGAMSLESGSYFIGLVSEGANPNRELKRIGTGSSTFTFYSDGSRPPIDLGSLGEQDLLGQAVLHGGECETWGFSVPPGTLAVEVLFAPETTGRPVLTLAPGTYPPSPPPGYGSEGGATAQWQCSLTQAVIIPNPVPTNYSLTVQATGSETNYPDANVTFRVRNLAIPVLNFDAQLNTNGFVDMEEGVLQDGHKDYYRVEVPEFLGGKPVIGWKLSLDALFGVPEMRVCKGALPTDTSPGTSTNYSRQAVLVPDYLTPGTWYVEVSATGLTHYILSSEALRLLRSPWQMPAVGQTVTTPGLPIDGALFGDTGVGTNGVTLPGDRGTDLEQDSYHYYAVLVPPANEGLLRTKLTAISGNPNLYLRTNAPPTLSHNSQGGGGPLYNRSLTNSGTEYGNWVVLNGRSELSLTPGLWYLAVHAAWGGAVRYRLELSTGEVTDLSFDRGSLIGQSLAAGDWRYYRVRVPIDAPSEWSISFAKEQGDVAVYLRDLVPPGLGAVPGDYIDWNTDKKNQGPYPWLSSEGSYTFSVPPLRPDHTYYLGVRALSDASFSLSSVPGADALALDGVLGFHGGFVTNHIPPGGVLRYRVDVPVSAQRWAHTAFHASSVRCFLEQGTLPTMTTAAHWYSSGPNSSFNVSLSNGTWPWLAGYHYFLAVTNSSAVEQPFSVWINGVGGTNATPVISNPVLGPGGRIVFTVTGTANSSFRVLVTSRIHGEGWQVYTNFTQTLPTQQISLPLDPAFSERYYRLVTP